MHTYIHTCIHIYIHKGKVQNFMNLEGSGICKTCIHMHTCLHKNTFIQATALCFIKEGSSICRTCIHTYIHTYRQGQGVSSTTRPGGLQHPQGLYSLCPYASFIVWLGEKPDQRESCKLRCEVAMLAHRCVCMCVCIYIYVCVYIYIVLYRLPPYTHS
jgi:hypothetical protein